MANQRLDTSDPAILEAVEEVRSGTNNWAVFTYVGNSLKLKLQEKGAGEYEDFLDELNDGKCQFALVKFRVQNMDKFVYFSYCGEGVPGTIKGRFNTHISDMERFLAGKFHVQVNARREEDCEENKIKGLLTKAIGANYNAGQQIQGQKKGGVASVAEGKQKIQNFKTHAVKQTAVEVDQSKREAFWSKQEAEAKNPASGYKKAEVDAENLRKQREAYWAAHPETKPAVVTTPIAKGASQAEREAYWAKLAAEEEAFKASQTTTTSVSVPKGAGAAARAKLMAKAAEAEQPPPPAPRPKAKGNVHAFAARAAAPEPEPEPEAEEWAEEAAPEEEAYEEAPAEEAYEEAPAEEAYEAAPEAEEWAEEAPAEEAYEEEAAAGGQQARALYDYAGEQEGDLAFSAGDILNILDTSDPDGWWQGELNGYTGNFPSNFVELI